MTSVRSKIELKRVVEWVSYHKYQGCERIMVFCHRCDPTLVAELAHSPLVQHGTLALLPIGDVVENTEGYFQVGAGGSGWCAVATCSNREDV